MFTRCLTILISLLLCAPVTAGPWLREQGTGFSAFSFSSTYYLDTASTTYIEYGLTEKTTVIADIGMARSFTLPESGFVTLSIRRPITAADAVSKWAYEIGAGVGWIGEERLPHVRTALSWGRGVKWGEKNGWLTVDGSVTWDLTYAQHITKIDATAGLNFTDVTAGMLQLFTLDVGEQRIATIAPSVVFAPKFTKFRVQLGFESALGQFYNSAAKISIWREF